MQQTTFDPGLTQKFGAPLRHTINPDGSFNVHRHGTSWRDSNPYLFLINVSWPVFLALVVGSYILMNLLFALAYYAAGPGQLMGAETAVGLDRFMLGWYFSAHTLTTVGYGNLAPKGTVANVLAAFEAMLGVLGFALATGLLFGRVSKPSARIGFSERALIAPYQDGSSLQFRVVNRRSNTLLELEARILLMTVEETEPGRPQRNFTVLRLERPGVFFLPLTWTVVHPIDAESPLAGLTASDLERLQAEILILIRAHDDTFSQTVHARYSYSQGDIVWGGRFEPAFDVQPSGDFALYVDRVGDYVAAGTEASGRRL